MAAATVWNPSLYQQKHSFVYQYGESLVDLLAPQPGENILDLGCGSGELTQKISETGAKVTGIDASADMIARAQENFPQVRFGVTDAAQMDFSEEFDSENGIKDWLRMFAGAFLEGIPEEEQESIVEQVQDSLKPTQYRDGVWYADYKRIRVVAVKPNRS